MDGTGERRTIPAIAMINDLRSSRMDLWFQNKVALVTGAGQGMGLAAARAFAAEGATVVLADVNEGLVQAAAKELMASGHRALAVRCDVADESQVSEMVEQAVSAFGRLDAAFN